MQQEPIVPLEGLLCPVCGKELDMAAKTGDGYLCHGCGETIPERMAINPLFGCSVGLTSNKSREMRR